MKKELSPDAQIYMEWINEDTIIDPDDFLFHMDFGNGRELANCQLTRSLIRESLEEINEFKPDFLPSRIKRDFNLMRIVDKYDLTPTEDELTRFKHKLQSLVESSEVKYLKEDPKNKIENTIISAQMIDAKDVIAFINGANLNDIYAAVAKRRREFDSLTSGFRSIRKSP